MPGRGLSVLISITVISVLLCWYVLGQRYAGSSFEKRQGGLVFPELQSHLSDVTEINVNRAAGQFVLSRNENRWHNNGMGGFPAKPDFVERVIKELAGLRYLEAKTNRKNLFHKLDVDEDSTTSGFTRLQLKNSASATVADIVIGKPKDSNASLAALYARPSDQNRIWLVAGELDVRYGAVDWSDRNIVDIDSISLSNLKVRHNDGEVVSLVRRDSRKMALVELPTDAEIKHQYQIDFVAGLLEGVYFDDAKRVNGNNDSTKPLFQVIAQTKDHLTITIRADTPESDGSIWATFNAQLADSSRASEGAKQEVSRINNNFGDWKVKLPRKFTDRLKIRLSDIIETPITNNRSLQ